MRETSARLMHLLRGGTCERPPLWEPWFAMGDMLRVRFGGDPVAMADQLGHSALNIGYCGHGIDFAKRLEGRLESGVWYGGGNTFTREQLYACPLPDYDKMIRDITARRAEMARRDIACWLVIPWCFHSIATTMGLENFCMMLFDDVGLVKDALREVERRNGEAIRRVVAEVRPDFVLYDGDCAYRNGTMIDPDQMRELTFDITKPNIEALSEMGIPAAFHSDGKLDGVIPLVIDLGFVAVHGCEKQANALDHLVARFGDRIVLCGNMDVVFLKDATPEQVRVETNLMLQTGNRKRRFLPGCNTSPQNYIPPENYIAMCNAIRDSA